MMEVPIGDFAVLVPIAGSKVTVYALLATRQNVSRLSQSYTREKSARLLASAAQLGKDFVTKQLVV